MQRLEVFQSLWAMERLPWRGGAVWSLEESLERIESAGFAGVAVDLGARQAPRADVLQECLVGSGLMTMVLAFVDSDAALDDGLRYANTVGAKTLVVCAQLNPDDLVRAAAVVSKWKQRAAGAGVELQLETHRFTLTNDLATTVRLLREAPDITVAVDLSHYVVGNELPDEPVPAVEAMIDAVLDRTASLQGRVANRGQVQIAVDHSYHQEWVRRFADWWSRGFGAWRARSGPDAACCFCCELGAPPYAILDPDGHELTDRWSEALTLKARAAQLFALSAPSSP